eukprot:gene3607-4491_t
MGNIQSQNTEQLDNSNSNGGGGSNTRNLYNNTGYHVLQVQPNSPSSNKLMPFFDFIVAANQVIFDKEDNRFSDTFKNNIGNNVSLIVYNIKSDTTREVTVVPSSTWGGQGLAGISIRYCSWEKTLENVWHVLDVYLNSPAHDAQLQTRSDYIVGTPDTILTEQEDFFTLINNNMYRPIQLYVYSSISENVRLVSITPNKNWGGSGSLGCDIGYGLLHRIPSKQTMTSQMLSPSMEQTKSQEQTTTTTTVDNNKQSQEQQQQQFNLTPTRTSYNDINTTDDQGPIKFDLSDSLTDIKVTSNNNSTDLNINNSKVEEDLSKQFTQVQL